MTGRNLKTLVAVLALTAAGTVSAWADELSGTVDKVDMAKKQITIGGETIDAGQYPLNGIQEGTKYKVRFEKKGKTNVLNEITEDMTTKKK